MNFGNAVFWTREGEFAIPPTCQTQNEGRWLGREELVRGVREIEHAGVLEFPIICSLSDCAFKTEEGRTTNGHECTRIGGEKRGIAMDESGLLIVEVEKMVGSDRRADRSCPIKFTPK